MTKTQQTTNPVNLDRNDPFADVNEEKDGSVQTEDIHIRIQQRNGRKTLTTVQGISDAYDLKKLIRYVKKQFHCNGTIVDHSEYGQVIQLQGDTRDQMKNFLLEIKIARSDQIKVHGFWAEYVLGLLNYFTRETVMMPDMTGIWPLSDQL